ncbi:hypothetical protein E5D57_012401 [Metarhizium anisopliae]|nr:hypothetical protein E5D57_012401 [Metarhizium anisopliae]
MLAFNSSRSGEESPSETLIPDNTRRQISDKYDEILAICFVTASRSEDGVGRMLILAECEAP